MMNSKSILIKFSYPILLFILIIAGFFRFYNYPNRISMGLDSARDAFVSLEGAKNLQFPLTGPFISIAPVTTGPWYWIQLILAKLLFITPFAPWLLLAIFSQAMVVIMYKIGEKLEGSLFGLILALITALSPNQISNAVGLTNPAVIGFYTSLLLLVFLELYQKGDNKKLGFILGLVLGVTINTHYQAGGLITLPLMLLVYKKKYLSTLFYAGLGIFITFIPTIIFELNNHWFNTRNMIEYLLVGQYRIWVPFRWLTYITDFWPNFIAFVVGGSKLFGIFLMILITFVYLLEVIKKNLKKVYFLFIISFIILAIIIRYYRGEKFFGYLQFFHPYIFIFVGYSLYHLFKLRTKLISGIAAVIVYLYFVIPSSIASLQPEQLTIDTNNLVSEVISKFGPGPFKVYKCRTLVRSEVNAFTLGLTMKGTYDSEGKPLVYLWGCEYPEIRKDGSVITQEELNNPEKIYPRVGYVRDFSVASPSAMLSKGWQETSPKSAYQSAARWWLDEQP